MRSIIIILIIIVSTISYWLTKSSCSNLKPEGMVLINEMIDSDGKAYSLWVDQYEVTNADFYRFITETAYVTTAEKGFTDFLFGIDSTLQPGSLLFEMPDRSEAHWTITSIWKWKEGAHWQDPFGDLSGIDGLDDHPVVHISAEDAEAYAKWAGKRLPKAKEWDQIAKMDSRSGKEREMNRWTGSFPFINTKEDGFVYTAPVGTYPPDSSNLYDVRGNVWEICKGERDTYILKGGSFLCHESYCRGYDIQNSQKLYGKTSLIHTGFRCVKDHME